MCTLGWPFNALYENVMIPMLSIHWQWFARCFDFGFFILIVIVHTPVAHSHNAPYLPPKILHNLCFSFLLGIYNRPKRN